MQLIGLCQEITSFHCGVGNLTFAFQHSNRWSCGQSFLLFTIFSYDQWDRLSQWKSDVMVLSRAGVIMALEKSDKNIMTNGRVKTRTKYYVVSNAGWARSRNTWKITHFKVNPRKFVYIYYMTHNRKSIHIFWDSLYWLNSFFQVSTFVLNIEFLNYFKMFFH